MSKDIFISWQDQLSYMEEEVGSIGCGYDTAHQNMIEGLRLDHGIAANIILEEIPEHELQAFLEWVLEEDE